MARKQSHKDEDLEVLTLLTQLRMELRLARNEFNLAVEPELVEACVYKLKALQAQYSYYVRLAKARCISVSYSQQCAWDKARAVND